MNVERTAAGRSAATAGFARTSCATLRVPILNDEISDGGRALR